MKFAICGSMSFAEEMLETMKQLEAMGHAALVPPDTWDHVEDKNLTVDMDANVKHAMANDIIRESFKNVEESDAILVLNYEKNDVQGYIGASTMMEVGLAYYLGKQIFLLFGPPHVEDQRLALELKIIKPIPLNGDISGLKKFLEITAE